MDAKARVYIIDDDEAVRDSLGVQLEAAGYEVVSFASAIEFLKTAGSVPLGCVVSDVQMPDMDGLELQKQLTEMQLNFPVVIVTGHADVAIAVRAMKAGAVDFIEKPFNDETLLSAIRIAVDRQARDVHRDGEVAAIQARLNTLSPREREVLDGLVAGHPNKTIAYDLKISARTVEVHRANLMTKMGAASLSELVRMAFVVRSSIME